MSGWFADPTTTDRFVLGDCRCPGKPHDEDYMDIRTDLSGEDLANLEAARGGERLRLLVTGWNLDIPLDDAPFDRMYLDVFARLNDWLDEHAVTGAPPNVSGAHSPNGSRVSASQTRTTRQRR